MRQLVVACCNASPVFETAEHPFDEVALPVGSLVERVRTFPRRVVWDDGSGSALGKERSQAIGIVCGVGHAKTRWGQGGQQRQSAANITQLTGRYFESDGASFSVDDGVDFCRAAPARTPDRLLRRPPFPPAAERCALAMVESII
jgi:hypothetical protein